MKDIDAILKQKDEEEKAISEVISGMAFAFEQEDLKKSADNIKKVCEYYESFKDDDYYATTMFLICHRFNEVPAKPWLMNHPCVERWDKFIVESIFNGLFNSWLDRMIDIHEDNSGGQGDKRRFITQKVLKAIEEQTNLSLYAEYKDEPRQAYWSPVHFKDTLQVKREFVSWWRMEDMSEYVK